MSRKKILFLSPRWPFPVVGGDRVKPYNLLRYLGSKHEVHFVSLVQGEREESEYDEIRKLGVRVYPIELNPTVQGYKVLIRLLKKWPLEISYYDSRVMHNITRMLIEKHKFDIAFGFFMRTAEYLKDYEPASLKRVLIAEDYRSVYMKRSYTEATSLVQKLARWWEQKTLPNYEPQTINKFDAVTFVSSQDCQYAEENGVISPIELLTNGTDTDFFSPAGNTYNTGYNKEHTVIFTGKLDVYANVLMVEKIVEKIMPLVWKSLPEAKLIIAGANPDKSLLALEEANDNIKVIGDVTDMPEVLRSASVFLHPHSGGSGIQNKLIEAMSVGNAVVTTSTGNQGINGKSGEHLLIGNSEEELAELTVDLLKNNDKAQQIGRKARQHIIDNLSWNRVFLDFENIIQKYSK